MDMLLQQIAETYLLAQ